ncbi:MAG: hypothetical protein ACI32F_07395 [Allobaculum sp.]
MPEQVTNYQCPACTGPLHFVGATGKLECDYCGAQYDVEEIEALYPAKDQPETGSVPPTPPENGTDMSWDASAMGDDWGSDAGKMKSYSCPACGAELICDESTAATSCPYCGNPTIVPGQFGGTLKPDFVIPFKLSKEDAIAALKNHYKGKLFLPKAFTDHNHIEEIQGVYVPFWLFDGTASGQAQFEATRSRIYRVGDEEVTETDHFQVYRAGMLPFEKVPVDASSKMPDDLMDSIEPYDYDELKPFSMAYLPGFLADKYDVSVDESTERADLRCKNTCLDSLQETVQGYMSCIRLSDSTSLARGKVHYALMPVWMLNTKYEGKDYLFAMNGQTGRLVGDLPMSWPRFWALFAAISIPLSIIGSLISIAIV